MTDILKTDEYKKVSPDIAFFIFFVGMFFFYTNTILQLAFELFLLAYVVITKIVDMKITIKFNTQKNMLFLICWIGMLALMLFLSTKYWAYSVISGSHTLTDMLRYLLVGATMFLYADNTKKVISMFQSFILASVIIGIAAMVTTPFSGYFDEDYFGQAVNQHRNVLGGTGATCAISCIFFKRYTDFKYGYYLSAFFIILTVVSGSRGSLLQLIIILGFMMIFDKNPYKMIVRVGVLGIICVVVLLLLRNIPILYENIWMRFEIMFETLFGDKVTDGSTAGREYYREIAFNMFKERPWLGWGMDGFYCYLRDNPIYNDVRIEAVYSHCNYSELMSSLGIVGLVIWYVPVAFITVRLAKLVKNHPLIKYFFYLTISMIVLDYARIPWSSHFTIYPYFFIALIALNCGYEVKSRNSKEKSDNPEKKSKKLSVKIK